MSTLPSPVKDTLRDPVDEVAVQRMWRNVAARRARSRFTDATQRARIVGGSLAIAACALLAFWFVRRAPVQTMEPPGPLHTAAGREIAVLDAPVAGGARAISLSDGSTLSLAPGARIESLENTGHSFVALLAQGRVTFDVAPGGPRRWSLECGLATVDVVGTRFVVDRDEAHVRVDVERGTVLVRGERVPDRVVRLAAGESLEVRGTAMAMAPAASANASTAGVPAPIPAGAHGMEIPVPTSEHAVPAPPPATSRRTSPAPVAIEPAAPVAIEPAAPVAIEPAAPAVATGWRDLARRGAYGEAYGALGTGGIEHVSQGASAEELLALADVARLSGHPADAVAPLERVLQDHAGDPSAPLAAFILGRVQLDALGQPARAASAFERAIHLGIARGLMEDAIARLVEARARAGDAAGARRAADEYAQRFPEGRHAAAVRRWAPGP